MDRKNADHKPLVLVREEESGESCNCTSVSCRTANEAWQESTENVVPNTLAKTEFREGSSRSYFEDLD
jgi:hypothetical protein